MNTIDPSHGLVAALRAQLAALRERTALRGEATAAAEAPRRKPHTVSAAMAQRIQAIAPDDPDRPRKAVRIYLEAELAREFGARVLNDPAFPGMLAAVLQQMEEDARTAAAVEALGRLLAAGRIAPE